jgi:hypothetical protein
LCGLLRHLRPRPPGLLPAGAGLRRAVSGEACAELTLEPVASVALVARAQGLNAKPGVQVADGPSSEHHHNRRRIPLVVSCRRPSGPSTPPSIKWLNLAILWRPCRSARIDPLPFRVPGTRLRYESGRRVVLSGGTAPRDDGCIPQCWSDRCPSSYGIGHACEWGNCAAAMLLGMRGHPALCD